MVQTSSKLMLIILKNTPPNKVPIIYLRWVIISLLILRQGHYCRVHPHIEIPIMVKWFFKIIYAPRIHQLWSNWMIFSSTSTKFDTW